MSGFKYEVGDILEDETGHLVKVVSITEDSPHPYLAGATDGPAYYDNYAEHELTWPNADHFKVGQTVEVVSDEIAEVGVIGERGFIREIDDPVFDNLPIFVEMESEGEWFFSPIELKVIEDVEDVEDTDEGEGEEREKFLANWEGGAFDVNLRGGSDAAKVLFALLGSVIPVNDESKSLARLLDQLLRHFPDPDGVFDEAVGEYEIHFRNGAFYVGEPDEGFVFSSGVDPKDRDSELAIYRQEIFRLNRELARSNAQGEECRKRSEELADMSAMNDELIHLLLDVQWGVEEISRSITDLRDKHIERRELKREESK